MEEHSCKFWKMQQNIIGNENFEKKKLLNLKKKKNNVFLCELLKTLKYELQVFKSVL